ncbi:AAA family ATPase [Myxococcota bacterium]|nr:AAA family ATPase [Myxococcota bacterium]
MPLPPPYLQGAYLLPERVPSPARHPFTLPVVAGLDLVLDRAVTVFVGENGTGKSTVLQALAVLARLPPGGGGRAELGYDHQVPADLSAPLAGAMRPRFRRQPRRAWFFRADMQGHFAEALASRHGHHAYGDDEDALFADRPLHTLSHGEAFLATIHNRARGGLILLDEPESALSPQRQLSLLALLARAVRAGDTQVIMATHSPIMMTFPEARLLSFDEGRVRPTTLEQTRHYEITRGILESPARYWQHLLD